MSAVVYSSYPPSDPPSHPDAGWTRFVCISDTHSRKFELIPEGDVLLHAGDLSSWGMHKQLETTVSWLKELPHELKIVIAGNHDFCLDSRWKSSIQNFYRGLNAEEVDNSIKMMRNASAREAGIVYLDHEQAEITTSKGVKWKIYGSPAAPLHVQGAFQYDGPREAEMEWSRIPDDVEILMTHTPAFGTLDKTRKGKEAGCQELGERVRRLDSCRLHVFGHIHEAYGADIRSREPDGRGTVLQFVSVNAALPDSGQAIIVDLKKEAYVDSEVMSV